MPVDVSEVLKFAADLEAAQPRVGRDTAAAVRKTAKAVEVAAKAGAPVGPPPTGGELRDSIDTKFYGDGRSGRMSAVVRAGTDHGYLVEHGTSRMGPRPFMASALSGQEASFVQAIAKIVAGVL